MALAAASVEMLADLTLMLQALVVVVMLEASVATTVVSRLIPLIRWLLGRLLWSAAIFPHVPKVLSSLLHVASV